MRIGGWERSLYRILTVSVLLTAGCSSEEPAKSQRDTSASASADQATGSDGQAARLPRILFVGDSITAGYGLEPHQAFPALIQSMLDSAGYRYEVVNAGLSGETTSGGARRIDWLLRGGADIVVIELGGNDGLRGIPPDVSEENLKSIVTSIRERSPGAAVVLGGMRMPLNMGERFRNDFESVYRRVAEETDVVFIPHILEGVGGIRALNQGDGIHPTAEGQRIVADNVWEYLEPVLVERTKLTPAT